MRINQVLDYLYPTARILQRVLQQALVVLGPLTEGSVPFWCGVEVIEQLVNDLQVVAFTELNQK